MLQRSHRTILITSALALLPTFAWGQAAAEYGMNASKSATTAAKARSSVDSNLKQVGDRLQRKVSKSPQSTIEENRRVLEQKAQEGSATIHINTVPDKAAVSVDGNLVAYTPADLKVSEGKHLIEVTSPAFLPWKREIAVVRGKDVSLKLQLESKYKSSINLSLQK